MPLITERFVKDLENSPPKWHWDSRTRGFAVRALGDERSSYYVKYRVAGRQVKHCIGSSSLLSVPQARARAEEILAQARLGRDVLAELKAAQEPVAGPARHTVADLAEVHQEFHSPPEIKASSWRVCASAWNAHIVPRLGTKIVEELTRDDIRRFAASVPGHAARRTALTVLGKALQDSEEFEPPWRPEGSNPCRRVKRPPQRSRDRILTKEELRRFVRTIGEMRNERYLSLQLATCLMLLLFTGLRVSEWLSAEWKDVDLEFQVYKLRESKTGARTVRLPDQAVALLYELRREVGTEWVIPTAAGDGPVTKFPRVRWERILERAGIADFHIHDLRHTAASYAHAFGATAQQVSSMLGHSNLRTTGRYLNLTFEMEQEAATMASQAILEIIGPPPGGELPPPVRSS